MLLLGSCHLQTRVGSGYGTAWFDLKLKIHRTAPTSGLPIWYFMSLC
jgi:hypothetical protein